MIDILKRYYKLIFIMFFFVTCIFYFQFRYSSDIFKELSEEKINDNITLMNLEVSNWIDQKVMAIEDSANFIENVDNNEARLAYLKQKLEKSPDLNSIYYLSTENQMINGSGWMPAPGQDLRNRPWYVSAINMNDLVFTEVFLNASEDDIILSLAMPVRNKEGLPEGVVAGDISLDSLSAILNKYTLIPEAKSFLLDEKGLLIVGSESEVADAGTVSYEEYLNYSVDDKVTLEGTEGFFVSREMKNSNWKILLFVPAIYSQGPIIALTFLFAATLLIFLVVMYAFTYFQRKVITEPLVDFEKAVQEQIKSENSKFKALFENSSDAIVIFDSENKIVDVNKKFEKLFDYYSEEIKGKDIDSLIVKNENIEEAKKYTDLLFSEKVDSVETVRYDKSGTAKEVELKGIPIIFNGNLSGGFASYTDISQRKAVEREIMHLSYHDFLTGVYNRRYFEEKIVEIDKKENLPITIIMADLNGLKLANDAFGHSFGDELLLKTSEIISSHLGENDFVARTGGDEFIIVMPGTDDQKAKEFVSDLSKVFKDTRLGSIDLSVSFGWETKRKEEENIIELLNKAESYMYKRKLSESPSMISSTIKIIINTLHEKNQREKLHSERVAQICVDIGREMGFNQGELDELHLVGLMHDIGKIGVDENILNKDGFLTEDEYKEIKKHPEVGYRILSSTNEMSDLADYTLAHHERWDGKGYPKGISGEEIPLVARIISVADAFDAMTSERTYREALSKESAINELQKYAGIQFDPGVVKIFIEKVLNS